MALGRRDLLVAAVLGLVPLPAWAGEFAYRGWRFDTAPIDDHLSDDLVRSLQAQIDIVESVGLKPSIKAFFQGVPKEIDATTPRGAGAYDFNRHRMYLSAEIDPPRNPVLLHELIHAYHDRRLPGGVNNDQVIGWYNQAGKSGLFPARSYMMTNVVEFFAMCASVVLWGRAARPPSTRETVRQALPDMYDWIAREFTATGLVALPA
jgi:hypothetical protein